MSAIFIFIGKLIFVLILVVALLISGVVGLPFEILSRFSRFVSLLKKS